MEYSKFKSLLRRVIVVPIGGHGSACGIAFVGILRLEQILAVG